jgi:hypothetical protein
MQKTWERVVIKVLSTGKNQNRNTIRIIDIDQNTAGSRNIFPSTLHNLYEPLEKGNAL